MLKINRNEDTLRKTFDVWGYGNSLDIAEMSYYINRLSDDLILDFMEYSNLDFAGMKICIDKNKGIKASYTIYEPRTITKTICPVNSYSTIAFAVYAENSKLHDFEKFRKQLLKVVDFETDDDFVRNSFGFYEEIGRKIKLYNSHDIMFLFIDTI